MNRRTFAIIRDDGHKFVFLWPPGDEHQILRHALKMTDDPESSFDLDDYANLAHTMKELSETEQEYLSQLIITFDALWTDPGLT